MTKITLCRFDREVIGKKFVKLQKKSHLNLASVLLLKVSNRVMYKFS